MQIVRQFLGQGMRVSLLGCATGLGLAGAFTKVLAGMLFGVSPWDAITMTGVIVLVIAVSITASLLPAVRAARIEQMQVLRSPNWSRSGSKASRVSSVISGSPLQAGAWPTRVTEVLRLLTALPGADIGM